MTEGVVAAWHKKVGDKVASGDLLAEIEMIKLPWNSESYEVLVFVLHVGVQAGGNRLLGH